MPPTPKCQHCNALPATTSVLTPVPGEQKHLCRACVVRYWWELGEEKRTTDGDEDGAEKRRTRRKRRG